MAKTSRFSHTSTHMVGLRSPVWLWATAVLCQAGYILSWQQEPFIVASSNISECPSYSRPELRVAIIGAGASGTTAAYLLSKAQERLHEVHMQGLPGCEGAVWPERVQTTVYERDRVGGRVHHVHPLDDLQQAPVEMGASILSSANQHILYATDKFGIKRVPPEQIHGGGYGLWNGKEVLIDQFSDTKWDQLRLYWRYGRSLSIAFQLMQRALTSFLQLYSPMFLQERSSPTSKSGFPWSSVKGLVHSLGLQDPSTVSTKNYYMSHKVSAAFVDEVINGVTRANYAQHVEHIHALAGMVSMAATNAFSMEGGNTQIFERMLAASGATVHTGIAGQVTGLMRMQGASSQWWVGTRDGRGSVFDAVIIATPWQSAHITLLNTEHTVPMFDMQQVHVTLVATDAPRPSQAYFGYAATSQVPRTILTTQAPDGSVPEFLSLSYLREMHHVRHAGTTWDKLYLVKLFSLAPLSPQQLERILSGRNVWTRHHAWSAYPQLTPPSKWPSFHVAQNLYNINAMERWVSTVETSTIAAKNTVASLLQNWLGAGFVLGQNCTWESASVAAHWDTWGCT